VPKERSEVSRTVHHPEDVNSVRKRAIKYQNVFEIGHAKYSQRCKTGIIAPGAPAHFGLCSEKSKRLMRGDKESMAGFGS
jgi:hypothetical protein